MIVGIEKQREYRSIIKSRKNFLDKDFCLSCCGKNNTSNRESLIERNKKNKNKTFEERYGIEKSKKIKHKISQTCIEKKINVGDKNGMKKSENKKKVSEARKQMFLSGTLSKDEIATKNRAAWAAGKFDGVRVGQCKWFNFIKKDGNLIKCQGTWELAFVKWMDDIGLNFITHKGRIPYVDKNRRFTFLLSRFFHS